MQRRWVQRQTAVKYNVVSERPFWREQGLNGMALGGARLPFVVDNSPPDASLGVLMMLGAEGVSDDPEERRRQVLESLVTRFGDRAADPIGYHEMDWGREEWTAGCVSPLAPGVLTRYGASLRPPIGRIHWAGTEVSEVWTGYMDGAVRAGRGVARDLATELGSAGG